jgi:four helix bundle protein
MFGVERFEDLVTWQRMYELSLEVWRFTDHPPAGKDFDYRNEIRDASDSAHRNVAEGFGRYNPAEFARFLDISRASALETQALLRKGAAVGYLTEEERARLDGLAVRGLNALAKLQRYLRSPEARRNAERRRHQRRPNERTRKNHPNQNDPNDPNLPNDPNVPNE